jgi:hypothetical protein
MSFDIRRSEDEYLQATIPASSTSIDVRVLWVPPTQEASLAGLVEADTAETLLIDRSTPYGLPTLNNPNLARRLLEPASFDLYTVHLHRMLDSSISGSAYDDDEAGPAEERAIEHVSEGLWIRVGEVRQLFEEILRAPVYVYVTEEGAFVVDSILGTDRAVCVMRRGYAHLMLLMGGKMIDRTFEDDRSAVIQVEAELRNALNK